MAYASDDRPTVLMRALAQSFADRLDRAPAGNFDELTAWLERTLAALPYDRRIVDMLRAAPRLVARGDVAPDASLDAAVGAALGRFEVSARAHVAHEDGIDATIATLLVHVDETDPLTAEHSRAVSLWSRRIALRLNLSDAHVTFAARCGMLHDVGKSRTPAAILNAPRALSEAEWTVMRDHTVAGAQLLEEIDALRPFARAARSHHERLDGKGYPDRLPAGDIPQIVRVVTVADCFNAMIGRRPYRLPLSPERALEQLVQHRGTQFDPEIVAAMVDVIEHPGAVF